MLGLGKPESKFGRFLRKNGLTQQDVVKKSGVNRTTISRLTQGDAFNPSMKNAIKIEKALRELTNKKIDISDFWM